MGLGEKASPLSEMESLSIALEEAGIIVCEFWVSVTHTHTHTHTQRNVHSCSCSCTHMDTHTQNVCVHTHSYTWMHTNSSTIDGKQNHMFLYNHIHGQNHILHRPNTFQGPWSSLLLRWKSASQTADGHIFFQNAGELLHEKFLWGFPWWSSGKDSVLAQQGARVQCLVGEQDPACHMKRPKNLKIKNCSAITEFHSSLGPTFQDPSISHVPHRWIHIPSICVFWIMGPVWGAWQWPSKAELDETAQYRPYCTLTVLELCLHGG